MTKLDLGCGKDKKEGFIGIDIKPSSSVDLVMDVRKGIPYFNVCDIRMKHFLEHLSIDEMHSLFSQFKKICIPFCKIDVTVPHFSGFSAFQVEHKTFFRTDAFEKFDCFIIDKVRIGFEKRWWCPWNYIVEPVININRGMQRFYEKTGFRNMFPAFMIEFDLRLKKCGNGKE